MTQPLFNNYGGLLQAYALQKVVSGLGFEVVTDEYPLKCPSFFRKFLIISKYFICKYVIRSKISNNIPYFPTAKEIQTINQHTNQFIKDNISTIDFFKGKRYPEVSFVESIDGFIVGSDQVWRPCYCKYFSNYYFDFLPLNNKAKKIAYAASFGVDNWEYSAKQTEIASSLASRFDAISVREDSAVRLCREFLGVEAVHVLDPTLLLDKNDYIDLVDKDNIANIGNCLVTYVLDMNREKQEIINTIATTLKLQCFELMPNAKLDKHTRNNLETCIYPKVTEWIKGFMDAEFVVTDSFHGTVFSIIFQKQFISIANKNRGMTRFLSLLKIFGLEDRLIVNHNDLNSKAWISSINYDTVDKILEENKKLSMSFLKSNLVSFD